MTPEESAFCGRISTRTYHSFSNGAHGISKLTAANVLDIAKISVDAGLLTNDVAIVTDAYRRVHEEMIIVNGEKVDGVRPDGSFGKPVWKAVSEKWRYNFMDYAGQHGGVIYNGNYGKRFRNFHWASACRFSLRLSARRKGLVSTETLRDNWTSENSSSFKLQCYPRA